MKLLNTSTQQLKDFIGKNRPKYAILSHTWGEEEILYEDVTKPGNDWHSKGGASKVLNSCELAESKGFEWIWIDTCCIDKKSSAELSESINSMFKWYAESTVCIAYLADVQQGDESKPLSQSRWFTRGWTLQELIAPVSVEFWDKDWTFIADRSWIHSDISSATRIDDIVLTYREGDVEGSLEARDRDIQRFLRTTYSTAQIMAWASYRKTTREEDRAYCLMGLFNVNMPLLYGEGGKEAFFRLQSSIIDRTDDQSILAWTYPAGFAGETDSRVLAPSPDCFTMASTVGPYSIAGHIDNTDVWNAQVRRSISIANQAVEVELIIVPLWKGRRIYLEYCAGVLNCGFEDHLLSRPAILLKKDLVTGQLQRCTSTIFKITPDSRDFIAIWEGFSWSPYLYQLYHATTYEPHEAQLSKVMLPLRPYTESETTNSSKIMLKIGNILDSDLGKCFVEFTTPFAVNPLWNYGPYKGAGIVSLRKPQYPRVLVFWLPLRTQNDTTEESGSDECVYDDHEYKVVMLSKQQLLDRGWSQYITNELGQYEIAESSPVLNQLRYALNNNQFRALETTTTNSIVINGPQKRNIRATIKKRSFLGLCVPELTVEVTPFDESNEQGQTTPEVTILEEAIKMDNNSISLSSESRHSTERRSDTSAITPVISPSDNPRSGRRFGLSRLFKQQLNFSTKQRGGQEGSPEGDQVYSQG
ncbi:heterokaryon incompatibility protein-domain-containing protein [Xylariaceae sp. FL1272]|nr:heterokaryon incompatibility protein-domain-containing protein [Xylariaceae sp. FL1272]